MNAPRTMSLKELQELIQKMYSSKDEQRGIDGTFMWLMEEVGELAAALREGTPEELAREFADVLAWLATIANVANIDLEQAVIEKYGNGCPGCGEMVCNCRIEEKP
ncbi:MazG nucleotide pyrophosphohydrolase domain-containing protein [Thalassoglobus polymorphus]|nr:MazG nucleotide pyrophosphohydrolase domain-containing protein [Thalassoglobus polymorphus]